ncbi:MAG: aspartate-semialdehyde dehydrogenase [Alphaproteobacteria bacterium]|nr:MAG: aspartate-semialdehyde dehydrogenase [Alphaproteobacteria bacterium]
MEMVGALYGLGFAPKAVRLFASARSAGKQIPTPFGELTIEEFSVSAAQECDIVLMAVSGGFATEHAETIAQKSVVIDNSSAFRYRDDIPLVIPEINPQAAVGASLIANPNCTTAIAAVALWPLHQAFGIKRAIISTYQAASGAGSPGMDELETGIRAWSRGDDIQASTFQHPLPFNVIPHIDSFQANGYTREEMKVTWETRKIFGLPELPISCTAVRIPTLRAHAETITIETLSPVTTASARAALENAPGIEVVDDTSANFYPMPLTATGKYDVEVGRIRQNPVFGNHGLDIFVCGDQLLKGAALNAVQIAELLLD